MKRLPPASGDPPPPQTYRYCNILCASLARRYNACGPPGLAGKVCARARARSPSVSMVQPNWICTRGVTATVIRATRSATRAISILLVQLGSPGAHACVTVRDPNTGTE